MTKLNFFSDTAVDTLLMSLNIFEFNWFSRNSVVIQNNLYFTLVVTTKKSIGPSLACSLLCTACKEGERYWEGKA